MHANELFDKVTADLITAIENGARGWRMPWHCLANGTPRSADGRPYRGWNALVLAMVAADRGWTAGTWATYKTWAKHGCQVRRGERGTHIVLWKPTERLDPDDNDTTKRSLLARSFVVFAAEQVDGADRFIAPDERTTATRLEDADAYFATIGADIVHGGPQASYSPALDRIRLPHLDQFDRPANYYSTAAHEHTHWTGHASRLARNLTGRFGDRSYGAEELVAELGAAFWCAQFGLEQATRSDHAAYLGDWLAILSADPRALLAACSHAQRAVDHLNQAARWGLAPSDEAMQEAS
ncbi:MAG: zincin-like metallopeptidase domain-containing protein [Ilumatobacteraceae bacterium]